MAFIFSNSLQAASKSSVQSGQVIAVVKPILDPKDHISLEIFTFFVRKAAHMSEFALLGLSLGSLGLTLSISLSRTLVFPWLFLALSTAVTDEFIQTFVPGRSGELRDVLIDFTGACIGLIIIWLGHIIHSLVIQRHCARAKSAKDLP